jgi:hypothetical protein
MKHTTVPLETVTALVTEPSVALGFEEHPDVAVLALKSETGDWGSGLNAVVDGCLVLGFRKLIFQMEEAEISSSFLIACIVSAWQRLIEGGGTLVISGLSKRASARFHELIEPGLFNIHDNLDASVEWLDSAFPLELEENFPRTVRCTECGAVSQVARRGDHLCDDCGMTYLVTERGEIPF